ncbi:MAG: hypothetical protein J6O70_07350 [Lachnospiraceae bacterium]|nr:hypothetical protein [Lachnospiraceae bacterium]
MKKEEKTNVMRVLDSPIGMKKQFPTFIHVTATQNDRIFVSAGKVGYQIELAPDDLMSVSGSTAADIV